MVAPYVPDAGDIIKMDLDLTAGHEQAGWRPALVISEKLYNKTGLAVVVPITSKIKGYPFEVNLPEGLKITGAVLADAIKSIDWRARNVRFHDKAPKDVLNRVRGTAAAILGLPQP